MLSRLGYVQGFADHGSGPTGEEEGDSVDLAFPAGQAPEEHGPEGHTLFTLDPTIACPERKHGHEREGRRDREALKVIRLARCVLGHERDSSVETCEPGEATANEGCERDRVEVRAQAAYEG
jgi:hypothetical protein